MRSIRLRQGRFETRLGGQATRRFAIPIERHSLRGLGEVGGRDVPFGKILVNPNAKMRLAPGMR